MLPSINDLKAKVWSLKTAPKIRSFLWRAMTGAISVSDRLNARGMNVNLSCQFCGLETENINHVLFTCFLERHVWPLTNLPTPNGGFDPESTFSNIYFSLKDGEKQ